MTPTLTGLLTANEFANLPDDGTIMELVRGRIVRMPPPSTYHGYVCGEIVGTVRQFVKENGRIVSNDSGVVTERDPDTVRGGDVLYYSFKRLPDGPFSKTTYVSVMPELVFEVRSPSDRWTRLLGKATEYLSAGVTVVCIADPDSQSVHVYRDNELPQNLHGEDELELPDIFPASALP
jgi:Uma2 family endonuclease